MAEVVDLGTARGERKDPLRWTPLQAIEAVAAKIRSGELAPDMIYIALALPAEGGHTLSHTSAGGNSFEIIGLIASHLQLQTERK